MHPWDPPHHISPCSCTARAEVLTHALPCQCCWLTWSRRAAASHWAAGWGGKVSQRTHIPFSAKSMGLSEIKSSLTKTELNYQWDLLKNSRAGFPCSASCPCFSSMWQKQGHGWVGARQSLHVLPSWGCALLPNKKRAQSCAQPPSH